jgi:TrmH family RNA methyltransferase
LGFVLTSLQNPTVKQLRKLHQAKHRRRQQLFLVEGTNLIEAAIAASAPLDTVCYTADWIEGHPHLQSSLNQQARRVERVSPQVLDAIATTATPDGVVATIARTTARSPAIPFSGIGIALETLQDPGNLGTIVRTAAATEAAGLWLSDDSVDSDHPKVLRSSVGAWFQLPMAVSSDLSAIATQCQQQGIQVVATRADAELTYWDIDWQQPSLILLGNEGAGLSPNLTARASQHVCIPMHGGVESLNVAIAAAAILYEAQRQRYARAGENP